VERYLDERGIAYTVRDVFAEPNALEEIGSRGYMSTPVTRIGDQWIVGYRRKHLDQLLPREGAED
jgi:glutaredoxin